MMSTFRDRLAGGPPIVADGAMGTQLYERLGYRVVCFEELNTENPTVVQAIHRGYIGVGAELIETNTFGCNRYQLSLHGLERDTQRLAQAGARLAREAQESMGVDVFVAGAIGPLNRSLGLATGAIRDAFREPVEGLLMGGVDLFVLETFGSLAELLVALEVCRECADLPVVASMTFAEDGRTLAGEEPTDVAQTLAAAGATVIGANCGFGPLPTLEVTRMLHLPNGPALAAMPNAGLPARVGGRLVYTATPEYFADYAQQLVDAGVRVIGGCCGTTPAHTAAMHERLRSGSVAATQVESPRPPRPAAVDVDEHIAAPRTGHGESALARALAAGEFVVSVEVRPSRGANPTKVVRAAHMLHESGATVVDVTDSAMARVRMNPIATAFLIQERAGIDAVVHLTTRDRNLMALQADLLGAHALGLRSILALTGDPPMTNSWAPATGVYDLDSIGLIALIKRLNTGHDAAGTSIGTPTAFLVGCSVNPTAADLDLELDRFWRKIEAGADFVVTQAVYDPELFLRVMERLGPLPIPLLLELMPLQSYKNAEFIHNELVGVEIPPQALDRMRAAGSNGVAVGLDIARETFDALRHCVHGVYIVPAFDRFEAAAELTRTLRAEVATEVAV